MTQVAAQGALGVSVGIDEPIDGFRAQRHRVVRLEIGADLLRAQIALQERHQKGFSLPGDFSVFASLGPALPLTVEIRRPLIGVQMGAEPHVPLLLPADRGGMASQRVGDLHIPFAVSHGLVNIEAFFLAQMLVVGHRAMPFLE